MKLSFFSSLVIAATALSPVLVAGAPLQSTDAVAKRNFRQYNSFNPFHGGNAQSGNAGDANGGDVNNIASGESAIFNGGTSKWRVLIVRIALSDNLSADQAGNGGLSESGEAIAGFGGNARSGNAGNANGGSVNNIASGESVIENDGDSMYYPA